MDITFSSNNKSIINKIVLYFINENITLKNLNQHINVIKSRYRNISTHIASRKLHKGNNLKMKITIET